MTDTVQPYSDWDGGTDGSSNYLRRVTVTLFWWRWEITVRSVW